MIAQQKLFLEQLEHLRQQGKDPKNPDQKEKKLTNQLAELFGNM